MQNNKGEVCHQHAQGRGEFGLLRDAVCWLTNLLAGEFVTAHLQAQEFLNAHLLHSSYLFYPFFPSYSCYFSPFSFRIFRSFRIARHILASRKAEMF